MPAIKQSVCFNPFTGSGLSPRELVAAAARIGYQSVEMAARDHWPLIQDHGLAIAIVAGHALRTELLQEKERGFSGDVGIAAAPLSSIRRNRCR